MMKTPMPTAVFVNDTYFVTRTSESLHARERIRIAVITPCCRALNTSGNGSGVGFAPSARHVASSSGSGARILRPLRSSGWMTRRLVLSKVPRTERGVAEHAYARALEELVGISRVPRARRPLGTSSSPTERVRHREYGELVVERRRLLVDMIVASSVPSCTFLALSVSPPSCAIGKIWTVIAPFVSASTIFLNASAPTLYGLPAGVPRLSLSVTFCCASTGAAHPRGAAISATSQRDVRNVGADYFLP